MALFNKENILLFDEVHRYDCLFNKFNKAFKNKFKNITAGLKSGKSLASHLKKPRRNLGTFDAMT